MGGTPNTTNPAHHFPASPPTSRRRWFKRRPLVELTWLLLVVAIAGGLTMARFEDPRRFASSGDSYWYMRQAQIFAGTDPATASKRSSFQVCRDINRSAKDQNMRPLCRNGYPQQGISPRYIAIFDSRPGYPLFAAPFVKVFGVWPGMVLATLIIAVGVGLLTYLAVWLAFGIRLVGVAAAAMVYLLPTGYWMTRMLADGAMLAGCLTVLIGAMLLWRHRFSGLPIAVAGFVWTFLSKSANGVAMALVLVAASIAALATRFPNRRGAVLTGGLGLVTLVGWSAVSKALALPSLTEAIQDYATNHFTNPDHPEPLVWLWEKNLDWWPGTLAHMVLSPLPLIAVLITTLIFATRTRHLTFLWVGAGLTGLTLLAAKPVDEEYDRLMAPVWLAVAAALGYAIVAALPAHWSGRPTTDGTLPWNGPSPAPLRPGYAGQPAGRASGGPAGATNGSAEPTAPAGTADSTDSTEPTGPAGSTPDDGGGGTAGERRDGDAVAAGGSGVGRTG
ncbi:ArnT family glycosyltransferase [Plantactinospora endophytica]|uniref:DUF2029 domain-containing protein n=1 Tax=Plantactinospora endophytica TaxID=673535 RepID=A0ABQ4EDU9_9ACTN|nr:hypothetical protein [Plantactinospora endophytica]GIG92886.1 hypothetical protein Pen02_78220 [Plantactinospora endophytica]